MKPIKGKMSIELTIEDVNYINSLIERDTPKPMKEYKGEGWSTPLCPRCEKVINTNMEYCWWCGQHIDLENYEL